MSWPQIKKIIILKCHLLLFYTTTSHFSIRLWCVMKSGFYMTMGDDQLSGWTEKKLQSTLQSQTSPKNKKRSSLLFGGLLPVWSTTAFWIPVKPLYLRSMFSKLMRCIGNYNACSQHWSTDRAQFFSTTMPDCQSHNQCFKSWTNVLPHPPYSPDFSSTNYQFFKNLDNFLQGKYFHNQHEAKKCFPRINRILKHEFSCYRKKQIYFLLAKKVLI